MTTSDALAQSEGAGDVALAAEAAGVTRRPMVKARQMASASLGLGAVTVWSALLGLITTPYLIRHLGSARYGIFALITVLSAYLSNLEFGFGHATGRFLARARGAGDKTSETTVLGTSLAVFLVGAVGASAVALLGSGFIDDHFVHAAPEVKDEALGAIRLGAVLLLFTFMTTFAAVSLGAFGKFGTFVWTRGVFGTFLSAGAIAVVALGGGIQSVLAVQVLIAASQCLVLFTVLRRSTPVRLRPRIDKPTFRAMGAFGVMVLVAGLAYQAVLQGPPTVLAGYASTSEVAAFAVPSLVLQQLVTIATSTSLGFMTFASAESTVPDRSHLSAVYRSNLRMTLLVLGPPVTYLAAFAHTLLAVWIGSGFADSSSGALRFLAGAGLLLALSSAPADVARALGKPGWVTAYTIATAVLAVGGSFALASSHGAAGVGAALFVALLVTTLPFAALVSHRLLASGAGVLVVALARPFVAVAACAGLYVLGNAVTSSLVAAVVIGAVVTGLYGAAVLRWVTEDRERSVLRSVLRRGAGD